MEALPRCCTSEVCFLKQECRGNVSMDVLLLPKLQGIPYVAVSEQNPPKVLRGECR